jgi:hypothetical protein
MDQPTLDPLWQRDYQQALKELESGLGLLLPGRGAQLLLAPPKQVDPQTIRVVPIPPPRDLRTLHGSALRSAILEKMHVEKTADPRRRVVFLGEEKAGQVFKLYSLLWVSSASRRMPFYSLTDAAVYTCAEYLGADLACIDPLDPWEAEE